MMLGIGDVRDYIAGLGIADNDNVYCGKLDNKKDTSVRDTEKAAEQLYNMLRDTNNKIINDTKLLFTKMQVDGPVDVGTDDKGIFESVIELDIYYER